MNLDKGTFGNSKACERLARVLNEAQSRMANRRISAVLTELNLCFSMLETISNEKEKRHLSRLAVNHALDVTSRFDVSEEMRSLTKNIITYYWRMFRIKTKADVPLKHMVAK